MRAQFSRALLIGLLLLSFTGEARAEPPTISELGIELGRDGTFLADSLQLDLEDIATSPLHIADPDSPFRSQKFYLALSAAGALWGTSFALDRTMQSHIGHMSHAAHDVMENLSYTLLISAASGLYIYGLYTDDRSARDDPLTGLEAAGFGVLFNELIERATGRLRPFQSHSHTAFFAGGRSFTSSDIVIQAALAEGVDEYFQHRWYVAIPLYSLVLLEGFTLMGNNSQWFSDVIGGALLGFTMSKALLWLHRRQALDSKRWRIFPLTGHSATSPRASGTAEVGLAVSYSW